jgi:hypothetical protein
MCSGFGNVFGTFGARTAESAPTLPLPLRSRKRANERMPASDLMSDRLPRPSPRRAAMKARTSAGVGFARKPPVFMKAGDVCEVEIEGVGLLSNPVVDGE